MQPTQTSPAATLVDRPGQVLDSRTMGWFGRSDRSDKRDSRIPEGLWVKCDGCKETLYRKELEKTLHVCPRCGFHHRISARTRLAQLFAEVFDGEANELGTRADTGLVEKLL